MSYNTEILRESFVLFIVCVVGAVLIGPALGVVFAIRGDVFITGICVSLAGYFLFNATRNRLSAE